MRKIRMCVDVDKTFAEGFEEYILDCKSRNLRDGTIRHYRESIKQIYMRVPADTLISDMDEYTVPEFIIALRDDPNLNDVSMGTYARDLKTLMRFFMRCEYLPYFEIKIPKADTEAIETYTDAELKMLLKKPDVRKCGFVTYRSWVIVNFLLSTGIRQNSLGELFHKPLLDLVVVITGAAELEELFVQGCGVFVGREISCHKFIGWGTNESAAGRSRFNHDLIVWQVFADCQQFMVLFAAIDAGLGEFALSDQDGLFHKVDFHNYYLFRFWFSGACYTAIVLKLG